MGRKPEDPCYLPCDNMRSAKCLVANIEFSQTLSLHLLYTSDPLQGLLKPAGGMIHETVPCNNLSILITRGQERIRNVPVNFLPIISYHMEYCIVSHRVMAAYLYDFTQPFAHSSHKKEPSLQGIIRENWSDKDIYLQDFSGYFLRHARGHIFRTLS